MFKTNLNQSKFAFILLFFVTIPIFAQETMTAKDGKEYKATTNWTFSCEDYVYSGILEVQLARTEKGGLLKLGVDVSKETFYIGDTVYIILEDGSFITCTDKGIREMKGKKTIAYYFLTTSEMAKLKSIPLTNVRFRIKGVEDTFSSKIGFFMATNKKSNIKTSNYADEKNSNTFDTKSEINLLYK